jgi:hypothetical protein
MKIKIFTLPMLLTFSCAIAGQTANPAYSNPQLQNLDPMANISVELTNISRSVQQLSERLRQFVEKFEKVGGLNLTEKQQRFVMGLEILVRSEQRVATLQKLQSDLLEKQIQLKQRIKQTELDLRPQSIERSTSLQGSTDTVEIRENRRESLLEYNRALNNALQQTEQNLFEAQSGLREAHSHVNRLRRMLLPQIEKEIGEIAY